MIVIFLFTVNTGVKIGALSLLSGKIAKTVRNYAFQFLSCAHLLIFL